VLIRHFVAHFLQAAGLQQRSPLPPQSSCSDHIKLLLEAVLEEKDCKTSSLKQNKAQDQIGY
jgi:hypothetical protein